MNENTPDKLDDITTPIWEAPPHIRNIVQQVLQLEKMRISQKNLRYINEDVVKIIKQNIQ
ncbi:MAG: hypothetical protein NZ901_00075 [Geminocystis sp.]|nr:hypothetical protein [Geminocystis sp.]HIK38810.1 hypothetical protein [Geminocystis sp. M7585_C2015_104]MCS7146563.1 hypothetical protein [Geminocystis sp.]MCX8078638.1 hypothetical protein [Geminocystis sp.]MDW8115333.1 hypothetical protein [Geminocystis sp.]